MPAGSAGLLPVCARPPADDTGLIVLWRIFPLKRPRGSRSAGTLLVGKQTSAVDDQRRRRRQTLRGPANIPARKSSVRPFQGPSASTALTDVGADDSATCASWALRGEGQRPRSPPTGRQEHPLPSAKAEKACRRCQGSLRGEITVIVKHYDV